MKFGNYLVYLAHTNFDLYNELIFSVYSFKRYHNDNKIQIIIYTDNVSYLQKYLREFSIIYISIRKEIYTNDEKRGSLVFENKIDCLLDATSRFYGNFIFVDTDTYFVNQCIHLFQQVHAGCLLLHKFEKKLAYIRHAKRLLNKEFIGNNKVYKLSHENEIWNIGAIGISSCHNFLLNNASILFNEINKVNKDKFSAQLAISMVFQNEAKIVNADYAIFHYCNLKEFRPELKKLLSKPEATSHKFLQELVLSVNPVFLWKEKQEWKKQNWFRMPLFKLFNIPFRLQSIRLYS
ncbi:MAG: hypothetical protein MUF68_03925 [Cyclobacteriaceae bacterium]|jgi:hypothetical protein|nr:hypothetical protein [Cyclobacteriaceae bacterium]